jgi:hypothetical protein
LLGYGKNVNFLPLIGYREGITTGLTKKEMGKYGRREGDKGTKGIEKRNNTGVGRL